MPKRMTSVTIRLSGCDDYTTFQIVVSPQSMALLKALEQRSREASDYSCMPILIIEDERMEGRA